MAKTDTLINTNDHEIHYYDANLYLKLATNILRLDKNNIRKSKWTVENKFK